MATDVIAPSLAKETKGFSVVGSGGSGRAYFNKRSKENKHSDSMPESANRVCTSVRPIYYGGGLEK